MRLAAPAPLAVGDGEASDPRRCAAARARQVGPSSTIVGGAEPGRGAGGRPACGSRRGAGRAAPQRRYRRRGSAHRHRCARSVATSPPSLPTCGDAAAGWSPGRTRRRRDASGWMAVSTSAVPSRSPQGRRTCCAGCASGTSVCDSPGRCATASLRDAVGEVVPVRRRTPSVPPRAAWTGAPAGQVATVGDVVRRRGRGRGSSTGRRRPRSGRRIAAARPRAPSLLCR